MVLPTYTPLSIDAVPAMDVAFSLPEDLARRLQEQWGDLSQRALESLVAQAYREDSLTLGEVRRILGHETRLETESFLKERDALLDYSEEELEQDLEAALNASNR
jgi:predicted HTH domain antitoxin